VALPSMLTAMAWSWAPLAAPSRTWPACSRARCWSSVCMLLFLQATVLQCTVAVPVCGPDSGLMPWPAWLRPWTTIGVVFVGTRLVLPGIGGDLLIGFN
jgi:hypothetical protein